MAERETFVSIIYRTDDLTGFRDSLRFIIHSFQSLHAELLYFIGCIAKCAENSSERVARRWSGIENFIAWRLVRIFSALFVTAYRTRNNDEKSNERTSFTSFLYNGVELA